jgi:hypothetical protein
MKQKQPRAGRQILIRGMAYAPTVELGVVFLFGRLAPRLGFTVENVHPHFPDCWAKRDRDGAIVRIEFEFRASSYANHPPKGADVIVCWEDDWAHRPERFRHLEIISLKKHVGAQRRVFAVGCDESISGDELRAKKVTWNVPKYAEIGDLVLIYRKKPTAAIKDLWIVVGSPVKYNRGNNLGYYPGYQAAIKNLLRFGTPLTFEYLTKNSRTKSLGVVRKRFQSKTDITDDWSTLCDLIQDLNPRTKKKLSQYAEI